MTQVSIKFWKKKKGNKNNGISTEHNTNSTYEDGNRCVRIWRAMRIHVYIHICRILRNEDVDGKGV